MYPRGPVVRRHDSHQYLLPEGQASRCRLRNWDLLFPLNDSTVVNRLFAVPSFVGSVVHVFPVLLALSGAAAEPSRRASTLPVFSPRTPARLPCLKRAPQPYPQRILLVGKLVDEIPRVAPHGEIGVSSRLSGGLYVSFGSGVRGALLEMAVLGVLFVGRAAGRRSGGGGGIDRSAVLFQRLMVLGTRGSQTKVVQRDVGGPPSPRGVCGEGRNFGGDGLGWSSP